MRTGIDKAQRGEVGAISGFDRIGMYHWAVETTKRPIHVVALGRSLEQAKAMAEEIVGIRLGVEGDETAHVLARLEGPPNRVLYEFGGMVLL